MKKDKMDLSRTWKTIRLLSFRQMKKGIHLLSHEITPHCDNPTKWPCQLMRIIIHGIAIGLRRWRHECCMVFLQRMT